MVASASRSLLHPTQPVWRRPISPIGAYDLRGIAFWQGAALVLDAFRGQVLAVDLQTETSQVLNPFHLDEFVGGRGLAVSPPIDGGPGEPTLWFCRDRSVYYCRLSDMSPRRFATLADDADGVAIWQTTVYVSCARTGKIHVLGRESGQEITTFYAPGIGAENLTVRGEHLWVCDRLEQTVYCLDRATGALEFSVMTPYESPTGLAFWDGDGDGDPDGGAGEDWEQSNPLAPLYVCYSDEEAYIRDDPNAEDPLQLAFRDRTFLHALDFKWERDRQLALSNGYLIEMFYVEEISPLETVDFSQLQNMEWRMAMPSNTDRQVVREVVPVGMPYEEVEEDGQRVAVFRFDGLEPGEGRLFGWKALIEVRGIRYQLTPRSVEKLPPRLPDGYAEKYLVDNDDLAMDTPTVKEAAIASVGTETNVLRRVLSLRNYVYDRLSYRLTHKIDTPDLVLQRGVGSCGEYVGVLLALARLNGIACRTVGRYKCPPPGDRTGVNLFPDYNHVWLEFYIPGYGWLPMESNPDDIQEGGPYPTRYFMGLPWIHVEIAKGIKFQRLTIDGKLPENGLSVGDLAMNHVRFKILEELPSLT